MELLFQISKLFGIIRQVYVVLSKILELWNWAGYMFLELQENIVRKFTKFFFSLFPDLFFSLDCFKYSILMNVLVLALQENIVRKLTKFFFSCIHCILSMRFILSLRLFKILDYYECFGKLFAVTLLSLFSR